MTATFDRICTNCDNFFPDSVEMTDYGICLADEAFEPYLDNLLDGDFESCQILLQAKRFHGGQDGCSLYEETEVDDPPDDSLAEI